jgi:quercetin dioxygenase-like cupin family protein
MPDIHTESAARSYDWEDIETEHLSEVIARRRIIGQRMMISQFVLEAGFHADPHTHHSEQISMVMEGSLRFRIGEIGSDVFREETVGAGQTMAIPPFVPHGATALERTVVLDLFSPPSEKTGLDRD